MRAAVALWVLSVVGSVVLFGSVVLVQTVSRAVRSALRKDPAQTRPGVDAGRVREPSAA